MSALPPKADICSAKAHVRFGPIADIVLNRTPQKRSLTDRAQARLLCVMVVASTSSTKDSGLFDHLLPLFTQKTGIVVNVLALGTGQALDAARHKRIN